MTAPSSKGRELQVLALALAAMYILCALLPLPLFDPDEGLHAAMAREMVERGDWVVPRLHGVPFLDKPVLYFWALATSLKVFGMHESAVRLPGVFFGLLGACATGLFGAVAVDRQTGWRAAIVHATMFLPFGVALVSVHDIALVPVATLALCALWWAAVQPLSSRTLLFSALAGLPLGLAMLTKGLSGVAAVGVPFVVWMIWTRRWRPSLLCGGVMSLVVAVGIAAPWYLAMDRAQPGYLHYFFVERHLLGFTTSTQNHGHRPWWYYVPILVAGALPWTAYLWTAWRESRTHPAPPHVAPRTSTHAGDADAYEPDVIRRPDAARRARGVTRLWWLWLFVGLAFFSAAGSKLVTYILPLFPAAALLVATTWQRHWDSPSPATREIRWADRLGGAAVAMALPILIGVSMLQFGFTPEPLFGTFIVIAGCAITVLWWRDARATARDRFIRLARASLIVLPLVWLMVLVPAAPSLSARAVARFYNGTGQLPHALWFVNERVGSFLFYLEPPVRQTVTATRVQMVSLDRVLSMRQAPDGLVIALSRTELAALERRVSLAGVRYIQAGRHRLYAADAIVDAIARAHRLDAPPPGA